MGSIRVTLSANAGVCIDIAQQRIWVDALHENKVPGFSCVTPQLFSSLLQADVFRTPDVICFTHRHGDHYSFSQLQRAKELWPSAAVLMPDADADIGPDKVFGSVRIRFLRLPHEGAEYADTVHFGILILSPEGNLLVAGDCATASPDLAAAMEGTEIHGAILDFPWVALRKGRTFLRQYLPQTHILLVHLPFALDDRFGYRKAAEKAAEAFSKLQDVRLLMEPLQTEILEV